LGLVLRSGFRGWRFDDPGLVVVDLDIEDIFCLISLSLGV
jgi:hypothetical protein